MTAKDSTRSGTSFPKKRKGLRRTSGKPKVSAKVVREKSVESAGSRMRSSFPAQQRQHDEVAAQSDAAARMWDAAIESLAVTASEAEAEVQTMAEWRHDLEVRLAGTSRRAREARSAVEALERL
jgi:hypothetical protein